MHKHLEVIFSETSRGPKTANISKPLQKLQKLKLLEIASRLMWYFCKRLESLVVAYSHTKVSEALEFITLYVILSNVLSYFIKLCYIIYFGSENS